MAYDPDRFYERYGNRGFEYNSNNSENAANMNNNSSVKQMLKIRQVTEPQGRSLKNEIKREALKKYGNPNRLESLAKKYYPNNNLSNAIPKLLEKEPYVVEGVGNFTVPSKYSIKENNINSMRAIIDLKKYWKNVEKGVIERDPEYEEYLDTYLTYADYDGGRRKTRRRRAQRKTRRRRRSSK
jgi:hypothetical protein